MAIQSDYKDKFGNKYENCYIKVNSLLVNKKVDGSGEFVVDFRYKVYESANKEKEIDANKVVRIPIGPEKPIFQQVYNFLKKQPIFNNANNV